LKCYSSWKRYSQEDDMTIINFITSNNYYKRIHETAIWKEAAEGKVGLQLFRLQTACFVPRVCWQLFIRTVKWHYNKTMLHPDKTA
jgi:hypothetical protein